MKKSLLFLIILLGQSVFAGEYLSSIFRIKDTDTDSKFGHCTGFLDEAGKRFLTAGHCFHRKGFTFVDDQGAEVMDLALDRIGLVASKIGMLDIAAADLTDEEIKLIKDSFSVEADKYRGHQILGYPWFRREKPLTKINCEEVISPVFREKMERSMGIVNLDCIAFDDEGNEISSLTYDMVKGASGSPAFYGQELIGVAFHFMDETDVGKKLLKVIKLSEIQRIVPWERAIQQFGLNRAIFEEVKLPNKVRSSLSMQFFINPKLKGLQFKDILDIVKLENGNWKMIFVDGAEFEVKPSDFSSTVSKMMDAADGSLPYEKHSLNWPLKMNNGQNKLGNSMAQFQQYYYGYSYFHGGCDLVSKEGEEVTTPVAGTVEAGFYGYSQIGKGYFKKFWIPWGKHYGRDEARDTYFEIAIVTADGYRFEFHHIDPKAMTSEMREAIEKKMKIDAGAVIGKVKSFHSKVKDLPYDHIHYNIIDPKGERVNCEAVSSLLADDHAPVIENVYAIHPETGLAHELNEGQTLSFKPSEIIVRNQDVKNDEFYIHQPHYIELSLGDKVMTWDFSNRLLMPNLTRPAIHDFLAEKIKTTDGETIYTSGDYDKFIFLNRFVLEDNASGEFRILVKDAAGNSTSFKAILP